MPAAVIDAIHRFRHSVVYVDPDCFESKPSHYLDLQLGHAWSCLVMVPQVVPDIWKMTLVV